MFRMDYSVSRKKLTQPLVLLLLTLFIGSAARLCAQLPAAHLLTVFPPGGKAGSSVEVTISGADLDDPVQLSFSHPGITAKPKVAEKTSQPEANKFIVTVAGDVPLGLYDARFVGRFGVSNPRAFAVGRLNEIQEPSSNNSARSASPLTLETTVNGHTSANSVDYFKLTGEKGQRILIECVARAIDSRLDPVLSLFDGKGKELERSRRGGLLDFTAPADGEYVLNVHDLTFRGGDEYFYRLTASTGPRIDFVFPPAGQPGTKCRFVAYGRNLPRSTPAKGLSIDGKPLEQLEVEVDLPEEAALPSFAMPFMPSQAVIDGTQYRFTSPDSVSNPVLIGLATAPVVAEQEPNNLPEAAQKISPPCEIAGQLYPANDLDWFTFDAKKGDVYWVEVFSARLGQPTSPFVLIQRVTKNDKGEEKAVDVQELYESDTNIGGAEFNTRAHDPAARFEAKENGTYRLQVHDLFNRSTSNPAHVYRLSLRKERPDFRLLALPQPPAVGKDKKDISACASILRRSETWPIKILAFRRDGFNGDIQLTAEGLPSEVSAAPGKIESGKSSGLILLSASETAASWTGPLRIVGKAKAPAAPNSSGTAVPAVAPGVSPANTNAGGTPTEAGETRAPPGELTREAHGGSVLWNVGDPASEPVLSRITRDLVLAVVSAESAPVSLAAAENKVWEAPKGGRVKIPLKVTRRGDFTASLKLKPAGVPALDSLKEIDIDGKTTDPALELDLAQQKLSPGTYTFHLQGQTQGKYRKNQEAIQAAEAEAKEAGLNAEKLSAAAKKAAEALTQTTQAAKEAEALAETASEQETENAKAEAKSAVAAKEAAEKAATEASTKAKEAESKKTAASKKAKELADANKPKDVTVTVYSPAITLKVVEADKK